MTFELPLLEPLATAYFLVSFGFAGYVVKTFVEMRAGLDELRQRLARFRGIEEKLDSQAEAFLSRLVEGDDRDA